MTAGWPAIHSLLVQVTTRRRQSATDRRAQIVHVTIATIAELGYPRTSFAAIAERGGLSSTRLISYHFDDRAELMREVAATIVNDLGAAVAARMQPAQSPRVALHAYLRANIDYVDSHRPEMIALATLMFAGALGPDAADAGASTERAIAGLISAGTRAGEFGPIDPDIAARVLQRTVEGIALSVHRDPDVDLSTLGDDLITFVEMGLRPRHERPSRDVSGP